MIKKLTRTFLDHAIEYISAIVFSFGLSVLLFIQIYFHEVFQYSIVKSSLLLGVATCGQILGSFLSGKCVKLIDKILTAYQLKTCATHLATFLIALLLGFLFIAFNLNKNYNLFIFLSFSLGFLLAIFSPINMTAAVGIGYNFNWYRIGCRRIIAFLYHSNNFCCHLVCR